MHHSLSKPKPKPKNKLETDERAEPQNCIDFESIIANSIHDMKNSLALLLGKLDQISEESNNSQAMSELKYEGSRVKANLIHLLSIYRIDKKQYFVNIDDHSVFELFYEQQANQEKVLAEKNIELNIECEQDLNWFFDRELLDGVIANLINNAYRYAESKVTLSAAMEQKILKLSVMDDGPGYPEKMLQNFSPANSSINYSNGSTGLGLYFASLIASLHTNKSKTGQIVLSNNGINGGGCFTLYLP